MRLTDILKPENIKVPLVATDKLQAIHELVDLLGANGEVNSPKKVLDAVLEREGTRSTGIGAGVAIPHGKTDGTDHLALAVGKLAEPIDFGSIDGRPVSIIWLLISPPDQTKPHIHALARVSLLMTADDFRSTLAAADTPQKVFDAIAAQEAKM